MKEGYTLMRDSKGKSHEAPIIKAPYLKNLLNKNIEVGFSDSKCVGILEGEDEAFISVITREGQELISKHSIKRIIPIYMQQDSD
jgi:hypothetical protein